MIRLPKGKSTLAVVSNPGARLAVVLGIVVLSGCATPPPPGELKSPVEAPADYATEVEREPGLSADPAGRIEVWNDDPQLRSILGEAFEQSPTLAAAAARLQAADAQATIAGAERYPTLNADLTRTRQKQNFVGLPIGDAGSGPITSTSTSWRAALSSSWEVDLWGRVRNGATAGNADFEAARADYAAAELSLAAQVAKAWYRLTGARLQVELAEETVETFRESAEQVESRFERGIRSSLDVRSSLAQLAGAEALLEQRRMAYASAARQLEALLGRYPKGELEGASVLSSPSLAVPDGLPAELLLRRPDLVAAERRYVAASHRAKQARRELFPRISLTASGGRSSAELEDLLDGDFTVWSFVSNLLQPIFQGGRLRANVRLNDALTDQAAAAFAGSVLSAFAEVETLLDADVRLADQETYLGEAAAQSTAARELAESRYRSGLIDYVSVLDAQRSELDRRSSLIDLQTVRLESRVDLYVALGGGFSATETE